MVIALALAILPTAARADNFDQVLVQEHAPKLYGLFEKAGYKTIGFLNFSLARESIDKAPSFHNAPITRVLPARLQNALLLYAATKFENELQLLADPSAVAGEKGVTSYLNPADRAKLFGLTFPVIAVGSRPAPAKPDAFVVGEIRLSTDKSKTTVVLQVIDARSPEKPQPLYEFGVPTDLSILAETGVSFSIRSRDAKAPRNPPRVNVVEPRGDVVTSDILPVADKRRGGQGGDQPAEALASDWIDFQVMYDSVPQRVVRDDEDRAKYVVKGVEPGQRITFRLKNSSNEKLGVAVLVNKKNVLYGEDIETRDPRRLSKLILQPQSEQTIAGIMDVEGGGQQANVVRELRGLSRQETEEALQELGQSNYCGHITIYVFQEGKERAPVSGTPGKRTEGGASVPTLPVAAGAATASNGLRNPSNRLAWVGAGSLEKLFKESDEVAKARDVLIEARGPAKTIETKGDRLANPEYVEVLHIRYWQSANRPSPTGPRD
jgi:hypothetical protein